MSLGAGRPAGLQREDRTPAAGVQVVSEGQVTPDEQPVAPGGRSDVDGQHRRKGPGCCARPRTAGDENCSSAEAGAGGVLPAQLEPPRPGAHEHAVGVGPVEQEHERRGERAGEQLADGVDQIVGHRRADMGRERRDSDAGREQAAQLGPPVVGPRLHLGGDARLHRERWRDDLGVLGVAGDDQAGEAAVGVGVAGVEAATGDVELVDERAEVQPVAGHAQGVLVLHPDDGRRRSVSQRRAQRPPERGVRVGKLTGSGRPRRRGGPDHPAGRRRRRQAAPLTLSPWDDHAPFRAV